MGRLELKYNHRAGAVGEGESEQYMWERRKSMEDALTDSVNGWCKY